MNMRPYAYASKRKAIIFVALALTLSTTCQKTLSLELIEGDDNNINNPHYDGSSSSSINDEESSTPYQDHQQPLTLPMDTNYSSSDGSGILYTTSNHHSHNFILSSSFPTEELHFQFSQWKSQHFKTYSTRKEHARRKLIWLMNHDYIDRHNKNNKSSSSSSNRSNKKYELAHNDFSDLTHTEFQHRFSLAKYRPAGVLLSVKSTRQRKSKKDDITITTTTTTSSSSRMRSLSNVMKEERMRMKDVDHEDLADNVNLDLEENNEVGDRSSRDVPEYKNWVEEGAVTNVKNQLFCGACWAFSAVGAIEGARYIKTGNLTDLSMQQLIDCDFADFGCHGGLMDQAFQYDQDTNVGLCSLQDYPFAYHRHWFNGCRRYMPYCTPLRDSRVEKFVDVNKTEEDLKAAIATQPVAVAVSAGIRDWQFYSKGIFGEGCSEEVDHAVLAVGYGHYDSQSHPDATGDYWLVKNSWGERWGMKGYIQLARGTGNEAEGGSSCILTLASRPILKVEE